MTPFTQKGIGSPIKVADIFFIILITITCVSIYGYRSGELGIYADDAGFLLAINNEMSATNLINNALGYVTGRNLHIVWHYLLTVLAGGNSPSSIASMHHIAVFFDAINACLFYTLSRILSLEKIPCFIGTIFFIIFPNHGETHFWISALPMNIISTFFVLILLIICSYLVLYNESLSNNSVANCLIIAFFTFFLALFTYDQTAPLCLFSLCITIWTIAKERKFKGISLHFSIFFVSIITTCSWLIWKFTNPGGGPSISKVNFDQIFINFIQSITIWISTFYSANNFFNINTEFTTNKIIPVWYLLDTYESFISVGVMLLILLSSIGLFWTGQHKKIELNYSTSIRARGLLLFSIALIILAYAPSYAWYISPRHNYLPSVGVALFLTICVNEVRRSNLTFLKALVAISLCFLSICFTVSGLIDKHYWIESYLYRKSLYNEIASKFEVGHVDNLVLLNFLKKPYPSIPDFLRQAPPAEILYITNGKLNVGSINFIEPNNSSINSFSNGRLTGSIAVFNCLNRMPASGCK